MSLPQPLWLLAGYLARSSHRPVSWTLPASPFLWAGRSRDCLLCLGLPVSWGTYSLSVMVKLFLDQFTPTPEELKQAQSIIAQAEAGSKRSKMASMVQFVKHGPGDQASKDKILNRGRRKAGAPSEVRRLYMCKKFWQTHQRRYSGD